jgi:Domain of unknown function (DUF4157)
MQKMKLQTSTQMTQLSSHSNLAAQSCTTQERGNDLTAMGTYHYAGSAVQRSATGGGYAAIPQSSGLAMASHGKDGGLPGTLRSSIENLSGVALDNVKVHYNSSKPAQFQAQAYAQGSEIYLAPGREQHLPHEAWHVVQQRRGRVRPTTQMAGMGVNDDARLEQEANAMGARALQGMHQAKVQPSGLESATQNLAPNPLQGEPGPIQAYGTPNITDSDNVALSTQEQIAEAGDNDFVVIARVVTPSQRIPKTSDIKPGLFVSLTKMLSHAGQIAPGGEVTRPEAAAVAEYVGQLKESERVKELIEFTTDIDKIGKFAKEGNIAYTIYVRVQKKYLTQSQSAESGWMAKQSAPYEIIKGAKDQKNVNLVDAPMTNDDLTQALNDELDAEFAHYVKTVGPAKAISDDPQNRDKYKNLMFKYILAKKTE